MTDLKTFEIDTETVTTTRPFGDPGDEPETLKGRCTTCWAGIVMRSNPDHKCVEITCRGCGKSMVGQAAEQEHDRMWQEQGDHSIRLSGEIELAYDRKPPGPFVWKIVPSLKRETEAEFKATNQEELANEGSIRDTLAEAGSLPAVLDYCFCRPKFCQMVWTPCPASTREP